MIAAAARGEVRREKQGRRKEVYSKQKQ